VDQFVRFCWCDFVDSEEEYQRLVALLDSFIDEVGDDESHPLASLMEVVGVLIEKYEDEHFPQGV
jgi:HTH-type transcriptional regulator/antitoxin HigA